MVDKHLHSVEGETERYCGKYTSVNVAAHKFFFSASMRSPLSTPRVWVDADSGGVNDAGELTVPEETAQHMCSGLASPPDGSIAVGEMRTWH
jgi:hypothetical protein